MYEHLSAQPDIFRNLCASELNGFEQLADYLCAAKQIYLCGIGTSYHAAQLGRLMLKPLLGDRVQAWHSFDFTLDGPQCGPESVIVALSHRGTKTFTVQALERAHKSGARTALIRGMNSKSTSTADVLLETCDQEASSAHTMSLIGSLAILARIQLMLAKKLTATGGVGPEFLTTEFPSVLRGIIGQEDAIHELAAKISNARRLWLVGAGPDEIAAREGALKIKETSYSQAEGMGLEEMIHGPFQCSEPADCFILLANAGAGQDRALAFASMVHAIDAQLLVLGDQRGCDNSGTLLRFPVPAGPAPFASIAAIVVLQLLSYHLALIKSTNPDSFRLEDARFASASQLAPL
jgi:glucosamine--fructose-6-phosphate aminotransferase (isomerizing)